MNDYDKQINELMSDRTAEEIISSLKEHCKHIKETYTKEKIRSILQSPCFYGTAPEWDSKQSLETNKEDS